MTTRETNINIVINSGPVSNMGHIVASVCANIYNRTFFFFFNANVCKKTTNFITYLLNAVEIIT